MYYTVGEMARMLHVAPSTLRFYDKQGLLPFVQRSDGGIRIFTEKDYEWLLIVDCLKKTGMQIKDIRSFINMTIQGDETIDERLQLFYKQREVVKQQMLELQETMNVIEYKCWYYETAQKRGTTKVPENMSADDIPEPYRTTRGKMSAHHATAAVSAK
ncbi:MAG: MerR family transcriptional regulator [Lachnospiraceae bacterium]